MSYGSVMSLILSGNALLIGDSIRIGYDDYVAALLPGTTVYAVSENCTNSNYGLQRIDEWLGDRQYDVVCFNFGLHDVDTTLGITPEIYSRNLAQLVDRIQQQTKRLIWVQTTPTGKTSGDRHNDRIKMYNAIARAVMKENGVEIARLYDYIRPFTPAVWSADLVHFKTEGYKRMGAFMAVTIRGGRCFSFWWQSFIANLYWTRL